MKRSREAERRKKLKKKDQSKQQGPESLISLKSTIVFAVLWLEEGKENSEN